MKKKALVLLSCLTFFVTGCSHTVLGDLKHFNIVDSYDISDESSMQNGMRTVVADQDAENEFLSYFFSYPSDKKIIDESTAEVFRETDESDETIVFLFQSGDQEYPKYAYGFKYSLNDWEIVGTFDQYEKGADVLDTFYDLNGGHTDEFGFLKPLMDYQDKKEIKDDNGSVIKVEYSSDSYEYGTYNSSGELYYDSKGRPLYRYYYVTDGSRYSFYLYDKKDSLEQYYDFGGMCYKGLDENPDIEIGIELDTYRFER